MAFAGFFDQHLPVSISSIPPFGIPTPSDFNKSPPTLCAVPSSRDTSPSCFKPRRHKLNRRQRAERNRRTIKQLKPELEAALAQVDEGRFAFLTERKERRRASDRVVQLEEQQATLERKISTLERELAASRQERRELEAIIGLLVDKWPSRSDPPSWCQAFDNPERYRHRFDHTGRQEFPKFPVNTRLYVPPVVRGEELFLNKFGVFQFGFAGPDARV